MATNYEQRFASFIEFCAQAKDAKDAGSNVVLIADPSVLGVDYEDIIESLNRLADAELALSIVPRSQRDGHELSGHAPGCPCGGIASP
jgi:hypothetical protein